MHILSCSYCAALPSRSGMSSTTGIALLRASCRQGKGFLDCLPLAFPLVGVNVREIVQVIDRQAVGSHEPRERKAVHLHTRRNQLCGPPLPGIAALLVMVRKDSNPLIGEERKGVLGNPIGSPHHRDRRSAFLDAGAPRQVKRRQ